MLIKETKVNLSILEKLDQAVYLTQEEAEVKPIAIPVREMSRLGEGVTMVRFADVERLAEDSQVSYIDAVAAIAEASEVDVDKITVAVDEATIIEYPGVLDELNNIVVSPISDNDEIYQLCESILSEGKVGEIGAKMMGLGAIGTGLGSASSSYGSKKNIDRLNNGDHLSRTYLMITGVGDDIERVSNASIKVGSALYFGDKIYDHFKNKPKNVIAKAIAALRKKYHRIMTKAASASDKTLAGKLKNAGGKILIIIDKLLKKLQQGANNLG
jgi:hypothetical protein